MRTARNIYAVVQVELVDVLVPPIVTVHHHHSRVGASQLGGA